MRTKLIFLFVVAVGSAASADPTAKDKASAKAHIDVGTRYFNVQQFDKAITEFEAAYLLDPKPEYLYALAQAQRNAGDCAKAIRSFENFLRLSPSPKFQALAKGNIDRCKKELEAHPPQPVEPPKPEPVAPPAPLPVAAPKPPPPRQSHEAHWYSDWAGHALLVSGLASGVTGAVFYMRGKHTIEDASDAPTYAQFRASQSELDRAHRNQQIGVSAMALGGALIVGSVLHYVVHSGSSEQEVSVAVSPGGAVLGLTRSF